MFSSKRIFIHQFYCFIEWISIFYWRRRCSDVKQPWVHLNPFFRKRYHYLLDIEINTIYSIWCEVIQLIKLCSLEFLNKNYLTFKSLLISHNNRITHVDTQWQLTKKNAKNAYTSRRNLIYHPRRLCIPHRKVMQRVYINVFIPFKVDWLYVYFEPIEICATAATVWKWIYKRRVAMRGNASRCITTGCETTTRAKTPRDVVTDVDFWLSYLNKQLRLVETSSSQLIIDKRLRTLIIRAMSKQPI